MYLLTSKPANPPLFHVAVSLPADLPPSCSPRSSRGYQWIAGINGLQSQEPGIQGQTQAAFALLQSNTWRFFQILFFFFSSLKKAKGTQTTFTSKPIFNKSCFLRSNTDCIFDMIKGKMIQNSFVQGWLKELSKEKKKRFCRAYCTSYWRTKNLIERSIRGKTSLSLGCLSFSSLCLLKTHEEVWRSLRSRFLFKSACQPSRQKPPCVKNAVRHKNAIASLATVQGQALQINQDSFYLKHTHSDSAVMLGGLSFFFLPCRSLKVHAFYSASESFFLLSFSFLMEKKERKMKSIFNVYRGARLNSLHSAETILNKLIFNEQPLCMRAK